MLISMSVMFPSLVLRKTGILSFKKLLNCYGYKFISDYRKIWQFLLRMRVQRNHIEFL